MFSILIGFFQLVVVVVIVGLVAYFLLRKMPPPAPTTETIMPTSEGSSASATQRTTTQKIISITYLVGGLFGVITTLPELNGVSLGLMSALAWLILLAQIAAAVYGGWQFWNHRPIGVQLLYWLSWSCVPVISFPILSYYCAIGFALFPTVSLGLGHFGIDFSLRFGYDSQLWFNPNNSGILIGVNVVALLFALVLTKLMREAGIPRWPLTWPKV